jgi:hypothetical protein
VIMVALAATLLAACSGGNALPTLAPTISLVNPSPTIRLGGSPAASAGRSAVASSAPTAAPTPAPTAEPTASPSPSPAPTGPATPEPSASAGPSATDQAIDPAARDTLVATLLEARDIPEGLEAAEIEESDEVDDPAFAANDGIRVMRLIWRGSTDDPIQAVYDYRYQFPDASSAAAFYVDAEDFLAETNVGMDEQRRFDPDELGEEAVLYTGEVEGIDGFNYNYLTRVGNVVGKIWQTVPSTQDPDVPGAVASAAAGKLRSVLGIEAPEVEFPNEEEAQVLKWIPAPIKPSCHAAEQIYSAEIDTVRCDGATEHPPIDYSLFESKEAMDDAFQNDVEREDEAPTADGQCDQGNYLAGYTIEGIPAGQILCTLYDAPEGKQYRVIEWTNDNRNILTYMSSATRTWQELIDYWTDEAGPINDLLDIPSGRVRLPRGLG